MLPRTKTLIGRSVSLIIYLLLGGWLFQLFEESNQRKNIKIYEESIANLCHTYNIPRKEMAEIESLILKGERNESSSKWNFGNAVIFAGTTILTVGYGNFIPKTIAGKAFCMVYAAIGIPIACITLKSLGEHVLLLTSKLLRCIGKCGTPGTRPARPHLKTAFLNFILAITVILLSGFLATLKRKDWTYFECVYFIFITISTIGFGDYVPQYNERKTAFDIITLTFGFLVGFSVMSSFLCSVSNAMEESGVGKIFDAAHVFVHKKVMDKTGHACQSAIDESKLEEPTVEIKEQTSENKNCHKELIYCQEKKKVTKNIGSFTNQENYFDKVKDGQSRQSSIMSLGVVKI